MKNIKAVALWILAGLIVIALFQSYQKPVMIKPAMLAYSEFIEYVRAGKVKQVKIIDQDIEGIFSEVSDGKVAVASFTTFIPYEDPELLRILEQNGVSVEGNRPAPPSWLTSLIYYLGPTVLFFALLWFFMFRQVQGAGGRIFSFGKSRATRGLSEDRPKTTFKDVAGVEEAKEELQEVIAFLKNPKRFQKLGAKIPKGVLLIGAPGTGKTLLAKAVAGEAGVEFFSISGSDFVEMFVGVGASRVRDLFDRGKKHAPCIIFIDEIDAVGRMRGAGLGGGHDEREQTLNQLLVEMDGFNTSEGVILLAATNRPDILDSALLRSGRFDRQIVVDIPDIVGRQEILKVHLKDKKVSKKVDAGVIARRTVGFVGSDIANLANEAALLAAKRKKPVIGMEELEESIERVIAGPEKKSRLILDKEKKITAFHECGHALLAKLLPDVDPLHKVSIMPRGRALGYTLQLPVEDKYITTKTQLMEEMTVLLGGRVAEELKFKEMTTGAKNDIERATEMAHRMVCEFGMSEKLGPLTFGRKEQEVFLGRDYLKEKNYSDKVAFEIDQEVRSFVDGSYERAKSLLSKSMDNLEKLAVCLMEREILLGEEVDMILDGKPLPPVREKEQKKAAPKRKVAKKPKETKEKVVVRPLKGKKVEVLA
ncbi:ATP-dependent zinc metalloprotease FtsH [bacterium]|nr:ATP-dependent zinc metalloprotease FtsH [bacterium]MBU1615702.1 ATP-dependent zinc metalloprotease FtsH [bacterium]